MKYQDDLQRQPGCDECHKRNANYFCSLPAHTLERFHSLRILHTYRKGTVLFAEGQPANGAYILCSGRVKLSTYSESGKAIIVRIAGPGEVIGLSACVSGVDFEATAQAVETCQANFVRKDEFLDFLEKNNSASLNALRELSRTYHHAHSQVCALGLSSSAADKLARLFLEWYDQSNSNGTGGHIQMIYTHEEIAEMIGSSRETVTRLLKNFADRKLINLVRSDLYIPDRKKLAAAIGEKRH